MSVTVSVLPFAGALCRPPSLRRSPAIQTPAISINGKNPNPSPNLKQPHLMLKNPLKPQPHYLYNPSTQSISAQTLTTTDGRHKRLISTSQGFVFTVDPSTADLHAYDPLTGASLPLPPAAALPGISDVLRDRLFDPDGGITDFVYKTPPSPRGWWKYVSTWLGTKEPQSPPPEYEAHFIDLEYMTCFFYKKAVLSPSLDLVALSINYGPDPGLSMNAPALAFARLPVPGSAASALWATLNRLRVDGDDEEDKVNFAHKFEDILFHSGRLHAVDLEGTLSVFDLDGGDGPITPFVSPVGSLGEEIYKWEMTLVESPDGDGLFLVLRVREEEKWMTKGFKVFKLDKNSYEWEHVDGIGDLTMFVGSHNSMAVSAGDFPNLKPNSIYFHRTECSSKGDNGIFSLEDGSIIQGFRHDYDDLQHWIHLQWFMAAA